MSEVTFLGTGKVKKFDAETLSIPCDDMCSYSETTMVSHAENPVTMASWILHNRSHLSRTYPKGTRIDSSNYMPIPAWASGAQLVALNYQTGDDAMFANHGKFLLNGGCGYVLKPEYMLKDGVNQSRGIRLQLHILGGSQLPKPGGANAGEIIDPFLFVDICGLGADTKRYTTGVIDNNGFDPTWNQEISFDIQQPDAAVLNIKAMDSDAMRSEFIAFCSYPISALRQGVRVLQLYDRDGTTDGDFKFSKLFVVISIIPLKKEQKRLSIDLKDDDDIEFFNGKSNVKFVQAAQKVVKANQAWKGEKKAEETRKAVEEDEKKVEEEKKARDAKMAADMRQAEEKRIEAEAQAARVEVARLEAEEEAARVKAEAQLVEAARIEAETDAARVKAGAEAVKAARIEAEEETARVKSEDERKKGAKENSEKAKPKVKVSAGSPRGPSYEESSASEDDDTWTDRNVH
jgi:hypothetical protein